VTGLPAERLPHEAVREALRLLGDREPSGNRAGALRQLREVLRGYGTVRQLVDRAPSGAGAAFTRLCHEGPLPVEELLGRGWWGRGSLPPPLDWVQRRGLVQIGDDGLLHVTSEAREGYLDVALFAPETPPAGTGDASHAGLADGEAQMEGVRVEAARSVVVAPTAALLDAAVAVSAAALRTIAPTVAVSARSAGSVTSILRSAGVRLAADALVHAEAHAPALPGTAEEAVGPRAVRALLERSVSDARQVRLQYFASSRGGAPTERVVDPWEFHDDLLRGYCHLRQGERTFAVDRVGRATLLPSGIDVPAPPG
jgi:hypothetical protein